MDKYQAHEAVTPINLENCGLHIRTFLSTKSVTFRHWNAETYPLSLLSKFEHSYTRKLSLYIVKHNPDKVHRQGQTMGQLQTWRSGTGEKLWLSMLVDTMEKIARPELRAVACDQLVLAKVRAQLARPASPCLHGGSRFSLRN